MITSDMTARRRLAVLGAVVLAMMALAGCGTTTRTVTKTAPANTTETTTAPANTTEKAGTFGDGTYTVGKPPVKAGTYRAPKPTDFCYWERLRGFGGTTNDIIANENSRGDPTVVTIAPTDKGFKTRGCGDWTADLARITSSKTSFPGGTYIVNADIEPGTYGAPGGEGCYWARLRGFGGTSNDIIANDNPSGRTTVTIARTDKGFLSQDCGKFTRTSGSNNGGSNSSGTAAPLPNHCSRGVSRSHGIPCELANNVFYEYYKAVQNGKDTTALSVWSPAVKQYRTANCSKGTGVITCHISGTNVPNAQVQITQDALDAYTPQDASEYAKNHDLGPRG